LGRASVRWGTVRIGVVYPETTCGRLPDGAA